jgi:NAD(P)-dependent dehydrogenase (short-subunit alcohol dehydrogenase family)
VETLAGLVAGLYFHAMAAQSLEGGSRWALVLGASSGFGAAVARRLAGEGFDICGVHLDRRATLPAAEALQRDIVAGGRAALFFNINAADEEKRAEVVAALADAAGPGGVRLLFHSLAFGSLAPLVAADEASSARKSQVEMTLDVMASSLVYWAQALVWRGLLGQGARVLAMTSAGSHRVTAGYGMVSAAKAALEAYVRQLAFELAPRGIAVNAVRAGVTDTPALRKIPGWEDIKARAERTNPAGRATTTADVAAAVSLLVRPESSWVTGNVIGVDGGEDVLG